MNKLFCVSGMSGSGKTSTMRWVMGGSKEIISHTTRTMRDGEVEGEDYYFVSQEEFDKLDKNEEFAEKTTYYGRASYAVAKKEIEKKLSNGNAYIIVDFNGLKQLKELYPDLVSIFIYADKDVVYNRMKIRGDSEETIGLRLKTYDIEWSNAIHYNYIIENNRFEKTAQMINKIISVENAYYDWIEDH